MRYFENLPIVEIQNKQFRNIFRRIVVDTVQDDQLIEYRIKDFETVPSIARNYYGSTNYWWVIALLNNLHDINFDTPLPTAQIEQICADIATEIKFTNSLIQTGTVMISSGKTEKQIFFSNESAKPYVVMIVPNAEEWELEGLGDYGYQKISHNTFKIVMENTLEVALTFTYAVFQEPDAVYVFNSTKYADYFDRLIREADAKRVIKLLKPQYLGNFVTNFLLALQDKPLINSESSYQMNYYRANNFLRDLADLPRVTHGVLVDSDDQQLTSGLGLFTELDVPGYKYDYHIHLTGKPTTEQLGTLGRMGIRSNYLYPRVYNTGTEDIAFDYIVLSEDDMEYSFEGEVIAMGDGYFSGADNYTSVVLPDNENIETEDDVAIMLTPVVENLNTFQLIGRFGYRCFDKNEMRVYNTGTAGNKFYWAMFLSNSSQTFKKLGGYAKAVSIESPYTVNNYANTRVLISPIFSRWTRFGNDGEIGYKVTSPSTFDILNSGLSGTQFVYRVFNTGQTNEGFAPGDAAHEINVRDYDEEIENPEDVCIAIVPYPKSIDELGNIGNIGYKMIDKNTFEIYSSGFEGRYKWFVIEEPLFHGIETFVGYDSFVTINIDEHEELSHSSNICVMITPIIDDNYEELGYVGDIAFKAVSETEIRIYNSGEAGMRFKWAVVRGNNI